MAGNRCRSKSLPSFVTVRQLTLWGYHWDLITWTLFVVEYMLLLFGSGSVETAVIVARDVADSESESYHLLFGSQSFHIAAPNIWNSITSNILECQTLASFRRHLKTHYFQSAYPAPSLFPQWLGVSWNSMCYISPRLTLLGCVLCRGALWSRSFCRPRCLTSVNPKLFLHLLRHHRTLMIFSAPSSHSRRSEISTVGDNWI